MLSVLLPIYNYNVYPLITQLHQQLTDADIPFEILCIDDASTAPILHLEQEVATLAHTRLLKLTENIGRSRIRNLLATKAQYEWLLFIDADCLPTNQRFVQQYVDEIKKQQHHVICGGIVYQQARPEKSQILRWKYGRNREQQPLSIRQAQAYRFFFSANFAVYKPVFIKVKFDENLTEYGLEDSLFAIELQAKNVAIHHIENPVIHGGLDAAEVFLCKLKSAVSNGFQLYTQKRLHPSHLKHLAIFIKLKNKRLITSYAFCYRLLKPFIHANLQSRFPQLVCLDLFKLYTLSQIAKQETL